MPAGDPATAAWRKPEGRDAGNPPLTAMTVTAENQVDSVIVLQHVKDVRRVGQQQRKPVLGRRRNASQIRPMERWIIDADDGQLTASRWDERALIDEQTDLVTIREFRVVGKRDTAVMIMVAEGDEHRCDVPQARQKKKPRCDTLGDVQEISGNE